MGWTPENAEIESVMPSTIAAGEPTVVAIVGKNTPEPSAMKLMLNDTAFDLFGGRSSDDTTTIAAAIVSGLSAGSYTVSLKGADGTINYAGSLTVEG